MKMHLIRRFQPNGLKCKKCKGTGFIVGKDCSCCYGDGVVCKICSNAISECSGIHNRTDTSH